ncbi:MAG: sulfide/dihydroorotate dehydrogenase-like FAD/NAD-binding protein [Elusimicrobiota bacterium]|jgi:NAD(P)H-flavin reductase|nr:sulfide/dihydroorotate dehydrogenase-like FAD/NAD-binding protein [Elusimicrobiota bacterium]
MNTEKNTILIKEDLSPAISKFVIYAPLIAAAAKAGQFIILRAGKTGERVPVTLVDWDADKGTITAIIQAIGKSTSMFNAMKQGDKFDTLAGPLGAPVEIKNYGCVAVVGGGVGIAEVYPIARALKQAGNKVISILGARSKELLILEKEMAGVSSETIACTDDGSHGQKGMVTDALKAVAENGEKIDAGFIIGPIPMMKFTAKLMSSLGIKPHASLNPIMLDGTGMCGCCRVVVGGQTKFACVDGPMFEAADIDFDNLILRTSEYKAEERASLEKFKEAGHKCKVGLH